MMEVDLVARLRAFADTDLPLETLEQILLAADEIERLRAVIEAYEHDHVLLR